MIYGYLSDTSLAPLVGPNGISTNTDYQIYMSKGVGVGQLTERVMSMFNTDMALTNDENVVLAPGLIIDPRTISGNTRRTGLFTGNSGSVSDTAQIRAAGVMSIHYDQYLAVEDARRSSSNAGNLIQNISDTAELTRLFDVIETILMTHVYDELNGVWVYRDETTLDNFLTNKYGESAMDYGYVAGTLTLPEVDYSTDKTATMRNVSTTSTVVTDKIGTNEISRGAKILFPGYMKFSYKFSSMDSATTFMIYCDPETLVKSYDRVTITHIVLPLAPADLFTLTDESSTASATVGNVSQYVGNTITSKIYKVNTLDSTNYTGAMMVQSCYIDTDHMINFTCVYRGRKPTISEAKNAVYNLLKNYLIEQGDTEDEAETRIDTVFPGLVSTEAYTIIPFYTTREVSDINSAYSFCRNVFSLAYLEKFVTLLRGNAANANAYTTLITIPGYMMHAVAVADRSTADATEPTEISQYGLDSNADFKDYQAVDTESRNWSTMTNEAQKLNQYLASIVASELNGIAPSIPFAYTEIPVGGQQLTQYTFTIGAATFSVLNKDAVDIMARLIAGGN